MKRGLIALLLFVQGSIMAQTVSTIAGPQIGINDAIVVDSLGNIFGSDFGVSTTGGSSVYKIDTAGVVTTFSTGYSSCNGLAFDHSGILYVVDFTAANQNHQVYKLDANGTKSAYGPKITGASGIIFDPLSDTLYVSQYSGGSNSISKLAPDGTVSLYCNHSSLNGPVGMAFDDNQNLYVANFTDGEVYKVTHDGDSLELLAQVPNSGTWGVGFLTFASGYLYATGIGVHQIFQISTTGDISVYAGTGILGSTDGPVADAQFNRPNGICTNAAQNKLYISDYRTENIRVITGIVASTNDPIKNYEMALKSYPNPVNNRAHFTYSSHGMGKVTFEVISITGKVVYSKVLQSQHNGENKTEWNTSAVPSGIYLVRMVSDEQQGVQRIVVQH